MDGEIRLIVAIAFSMVVVVLLMSVVRSRGTAIRDRLRMLLTAAGWSGLTNIAFAAVGLKGTWRSFPSSLTYHPRHKGVPRRFILRIGVPAQSRLAIKRRFSGFFSNKPITWFGPPLVEVQQPELWVRADESELAARIFSDSSLVAMISENLVVRFDEIRADRNGVRITRALDERPVRTKYGLATFFKVEEAEPIAREELALAERLFEKLASTSPRAGLRS